jgi:hypothetical protein
MGYMLPGPSYLARKYEGFGALEMLASGSSIAAPTYSIVERIRERLEGMVPYVPRIELSPLGREAAVMGAIMLVTKATDDYVVVKQL